MTKPLTDFYKHTGPGYPDGRATRCKVCHLASTNAHKRANPDKVKKWHAAYVERDPQYKTKRSRIYRQRYPERNAAHVAVHEAVKSGKLNRPECCEMCNRACKVQGHHEDYSRKLDVKWLCDRCHIEVHHAV